MHSPPSSCVVACPHCRGLGITDLSRSRSSRGWPAVCRVCSKLSYNGSRALRVTIAIIATSIAPAVVLFSWFAGQRAFAVGVCATALLAGFLFARRADPHIMLPVTLEQSRLSRGLTYTGLVVVLALLISGFIYAIRKHHAA